MIEYDDSYFESEVSDEDFYDEDFYSEDSYDEESHDLSVLFIGGGDFSAWEWGQEDWCIPEKYTVMKICGFIDEGSEMYRRLLHLLHQNSRRWKRICIFGSCLYESSAGFMAVLVATFCKADKLELWGCMNDMASFSCLTTGISCGLLRDVGVFEGDGLRFYEAQMSVLSQGLLLTNNLESFALDGDFSSPGATEALITGLEGNKTLKSVQLCPHKIEPEIFQRLLSTLRNHGRLTHLKLESTKVVSPVVQRSILVWLERPDCNLESLELGECPGGVLPNVDIYRSLDLGELQRPNTTLKKLTLHCLEIGRSCIEGLRPNFKNLAFLRLSYNKYNDFSLLDSLLLGDGCRLENLSLVDISLSVADIITFAQKLPRMKVLRELEIRHTAMSDKKVAEKFLENSMQNTSIEKLTLFLEKSMTAKVMFPPMLNRAGRRYLGQNPGVLPLNLFHLVVARASKIHYYEPEDVWGEPSAKFDGLDATFWLLRENGPVLSHNGVSH